MKTMTFQLTLTVEFDPQNETKETLEHQLIQVVRHSINNGILTGNTSATVEKYDYSIKQIS